MPSKIEFLNTRLEFEHFTVINLAQETHLGAYKIRCTGNNYNTLIFSDKGEKKKLKTGEEYLLQVKKPFGISTILKITHIGPPLK